MYQTVEAVVKNGRITPVETIEIKENSRFLLVRLNPIENFPSMQERRQSSVLTTLHHSRGKFRGKLSSVKQFIAHKHEEKDLENSIKKGMLHKNEERGIKK